MAGLWGLLALVVGLTLSLVAHHRQVERQQFNQDLVRSELAEETFGALQARLQTAESLLRGVQTLYLASDEVTAAEFATFYANLRPRDQFPSLIALAEAKREQGPDGERYVTRWVEPQAGNGAVLGLDVARQPGNLAALLASRDSDRATLSAPFRLAQQPAGATESEGVILRLPLFSPGSPPRSIEERRQRIQGSIAVSFVAGALIDHVLPDHASRELRLHVTDITDPDDTVSLFGARPDSTDPDGYRFQRQLNFGGRVWLVTMHPRGAAPAAFDWNRSLLPIGFLASRLRALLVYSGVGTRQRALVLGWRMMRRYRESEERFRALNELLPALVVLAELPGGWIIYANRASRDRFGEDVVDSQLTNLLVDHDARQHLLDTDSGGCRQADAMLRDDNGESFWANVAISQVQLNGSNKLLMVASDISEQRQLTEMLGYQASHDALTELFNRREFERRLQLVLAQITAREHLALLLYVDLDQFKLINDISGHLAGDQLLAQLALVLRKQVGDTDLLARLGGDEFGVLVSEVGSRAEASRIAENVRCCIDGYVFIWEQRSYNISASIGAVAIDGPGVQVKDLLSQADTACYIAKELGRNRVHFYLEHDGQTALRRSEMEWANRLRGAIDGRRLVLVCQEIWPLPLVSAGAGDISIEVLLRFRDDSGELVVPGVFMPAAERYGLMPAIDRWVVQTTLANFDRLHRVGTGLRLAAINLSGASLDDSSLADDIVGWLKQYRVDPSRVCFEVTETVAVRNLSQVVRFMERLRAVGCAISLDDFGAGMSSFTYLKNLPLDFIKIDGSFIRDMQTDPVSYLMVKAVTDIGHRLGLEVVAEWVTDAETVQALAALGVNAVQGFSLHQPELAVFQHD
jgi:diguanylate cyclase (GGDEF)-like protein/PAS domain S-box-containing protein